MVLIACKNRCLISLARFITLSTMALRNYLYAKHSHDIITDVRINKADARMEDFEDFKAARPKKCLNCANCKSKVPANNTTAKVPVEVETGMAELNLREKEVAANVHGNN